MAAAALQKLEGLPGALPFGVDHQIDPHLFAAQDRVATVVLGCGDTGNRVRDAHPTGREAGDDVHLVLTGDGEHHLGPLCARLVQDRDRRAVPHDRQDVELLGGELGALGIRFDQDDVLTLLGEALGEVEANLAGTDDKYFHGAER